MQRAVEAAAEACRKSINAWIAPPLEADAAAEEEQRKQDWHRKYRAVEPLIKMAQKAAPIRATRGRYVRAGWDVRGSRQPSPLSLLARS
jgi:hypothetical protein